MFSTDDTIVAIATPPGRGGIGVVRLSGPRAHEIAGRLISRDRPLKPRYATFTTICLPRQDDGGDPRPLDHAIATLYPAPHSYTGDEVVEISTHGSPVVLHALVAHAVRAGARAAAPGEFTLRAYLCGRIDLAQAEAVADLIDAVTPLQAETAFDQLQGTLTRAITAIEVDLFDLIARLEASIDFPDEGYHFIEPAVVTQQLSHLREQLLSLVVRGRQGRVIREGRTVAIVGAVNVGKSSLFNALVGSSRAIVTAVPGTTRDLISETVDICGLRITLVDTAGLRESDDAIEAEGMQRSTQASAQADLVILVRDGSAPDSPAVIADESRLVKVSNKSDLPGFVPSADWMSVSAVTGAGLAELRVGIAHHLGLTDSVERPEITNTRHLSLLDKALAHVVAAQQSISEMGGKLPEEFLLVDLQAAHGYLGEISGRQLGDNVLVHIFERFCIGK